MTRPAPPFLVLTLVATAILTLTSPSVFAQPAPSQADFLSIDCGATAAYTDPITGINWVPDTNYTSVGTNVAAVPGGSTTANNTEAQTLRYFKDARKKFCYELPVVANQTYLIVATFWYGNYDALNKPPKFKMAIDATVMLDIDLTDSLWALAIFRREYIRRVGQKQMTMSVCFYQDPTSLTTPFVSSIEMRWLYPSAYDLPWIDEGKFLSVFVRQDFGGVKTLRQAWKSLEWHCRGYWRCSYRRRWKVASKSRTAILLAMALGVAVATVYPSRYPDDAYDRLWNPFPIDGTKTVSTTASIDDRNLGIMPPQAVLQTAITPTNLSNLVLPYPYGSTSHLQCVYYLYFAEISATANATSRAFKVSVPQDTNPIRDVTVNIFTLSGGVNKVEGMFWENMLMSDTSVVTLKLTDPPTLDAPLVSGAEVFLKHPLSALPTNADDAAALLAIKVALSLTSWSGDPCLPVPYDWITCGAGPSPRVLKVKLNGYNLTGQIPDAFAQLTSLKSLQLANNSLSGSIPDSLGNLLALTELIFTNNNIIGTVPAALQRSGLALDIRGNPVCNCSPVISPSSPTTPTTPTSTKKKSSNTGVIAGVVGCILGVVVIGALLLVFCCIRKRKKAMADKFMDLPNHQVSNGGGGMDNGAVAMANGSVKGAKVYSFAEVTSATQNFSRKIGEGGFGPVYYGKLGGREVAVKVSDVNSRQGVTEFNNEVQLLSRVHHKNLVSLVGYCLESKNQMLVYEFLHKGTVREHLYGSPLAHEEPIDWKMRLDIALNSAQGLEYLHGGCTPNIIHRDVKSNNILLTENFVAKVADFGISRLGPETEQASYISTVVKGTPGYLDPEYSLTRNLTEKSDVYSFGVVLLELLCGRKPIDKTPEDESEWHISYNVRNSLLSGDIDSILDPVVKSCHPNMNSVWKVAEVAIQSVEPKGVHRPFMRDVVRELREAIVLEAGRSHASYSSDQSSNYTETARPALC